ncbi:MAG: FprA family A-type flavoprotein [Erysipelotrichaceae bacterium]
MQVNKIIYIGVNDREIDLFESQYVVPNGVSYNSYLINDEKTVLMDCVDLRKFDQWLINLSQALNGRELDYIVCLHMEPDHSGSLKRVMEIYPNAKIIGNASTFKMMNNFFDFDIEDKKIIVKDNDVISFGEMSLRFVFTPMIHWPEVMMAYESVSRTLFSADAFGKFGALDEDEDWACEARRYYFNIVGKYGVQVQNALSKLSGLCIENICPLHGPVLTENLEYYLGKYQIWSSYQPEDNGVTIACASIHGNTLKACKMLKELLEDKGVKVSLFDLNRSDLSEVLEDAFRYDKLVLACCTYDMGIFPVMEDFLNHLKAKNYQNRSVALIENGSWAPQAKKIMLDYICNMKNINVLENNITINSGIKEETIISLKKLVEELAKV